MPLEPAPPEPEDKPRPALFYLDQYNINKRRLRREWNTLVSVTIFTSLMAGNWFRGIPLLPAGTNVVFIIAYGMFPILALAFIVWYCLGRIDRAEKAMQACLWQVMWWIDTPEDAKALCVLLDRPSPSRTPLEQEEEPHV
jgi:hypothetical protein